MKNRIQNTARFISAGVCLLFSLLAHHAGATVLYWDNNGAGTPSGGTWNTTSAQWAATSVLTASTVVWNTADAACFTAGATSPGAITITLNSALNCAGIFNGSLTPPGCTLTISGTGSLNTPSGLNWALDTSGSNGDPTTIAVPITGASVVTLEGGAQCYLHATNTHTGGTQLGFAGNAFASILNFNNSGAFGTGSIIVSNCPGGALLLEGASAMIITNAFKVGQTNTTYSQNLNLVGNPAGLNFSGPWNLGGFTLALGSGNVAGNLVIISGVMSGGAGGITKFNPGTLELTALNTYTGTTTVNAGVLQLGDGAGLNGSVAGIITITSPGSLVFANPTPLSYAKAIGGTGAFTKQAAGILTLTVADTYAGGTTISAGTLKLGVANVIPSGAGKGDVSLTGMLDLGGFGGAVNGLTGAGTVDNSTGAATYTLTAGNNNASSTFSGIIQNSTGTVALTKAGTGMLTLGSANTYAGATTISAGTLQLGVDNAVPAVSLVIVANGATLDMNNFNDTVPALSGAGNVINNNATLIVNGNAATGAITQNFNGFSCIAGVLSGGGTLVKGGTHAMAVRGLNSSYGGPITLSGGTLSVGAGPDRLPTTMPLSVPTGALFQLDANNQTVSTLSGSGRVNLGGGILAVQTSGSSFSGVIQNSELAGSSTALGHGLRGYYYTNIDFTGLGTVRDDSTVNLADMSALPGYSPTAKTNQISVRWVGKVLTTVAGDYAFSTKCDDGQRLWVNGALLVDDWAAHGATLKSGTNTGLAANTQYDIVMEYFNNTAGGAAQLFWTPPGDSSVVIPSSNLLLPGPGSLVMNGNGIQQLTAASTYSGGTIINGGGTLQATVTGALGSGNVTVAAGTLQLDNFSTIINAGADLILSSSVNAYLNFSGTNTIHAFSFDGGATYASTGTYSSGGNNPGGVFTGSGYVKITAAPSANALTASTGSAVYGTAVTLTSTVTGSGPTPTGNVAFYDGANLLGTSPLVSGVATFSVNNLLFDLSPHSITAVYGGDPSYATSTSAPVSVSTTRAPLTATAVIVTKIYDGTTTATIASLGRMLASDTNYVHAAAGYTATFADKNVGSGKQVSILGLALAGSLADNYTLSNPSFNTTGAITPKALTITGITANNKVYDATTAATLNVGAATLQAAEAAGTGTTADGKPYTGDNVTVNTASATGTFSDANVANGKIVTINGLTLGGGDAGNYAVTTPTTIANITKAISQDLFTSSPNPSSLSANVTFTATLSATPPIAAIPTGNVTFVTNNVALGAVALVSGVASTNTASLPVGSTTVEARYTGDANFIGITNSLLQVVNNSTTCSATSRILSVTQNGGNSLTLNLIGTYQAQYYIVSQTNVAQPLANWKPVAGTTNTVADPSGHWSVTVANPAPAFYRAKAMSVCP